ncbi:tRNA (adenosine(37)-N6)-dimethylallyltransferase MiaA [Pyruvatibacter sp.]|uniref:tRNA (adenosine(37)-N6)-dimethylallyltransferase MiaA n=1 Tax=Pyruvatibacter sp. TaxID=1981328 RepID=UPI0032EF884F
MTDTKNRVLLIAGPTASGKSALAMEIAKSHGGEIINADSMQVYSDLHVLTARPGAEDTTAVPHHLYGVMDAAQACSAAHWALLAVDAVQGVWARGRLPILVGGTGLYFRALTDGLSAIPDIPGINREAARVFVEELGPQQAHAYLAERDPKTAAGLRPTDPQRIARALEVLAATGRGLADWQDIATTPVLDADFVKVVLTPDRAWLKERANRRFDLMMQHGALGEVERLMQRDLDADLPAMKAVGVPPLIAHLRGELSRDAAVEQAKGQTRRYIKRQLTWARTQMMAHEIAWKDVVAQEMERQYQEIIPLLASNG